MRFAGRHGETGCATPWRSLILAAVLLLSATQATAAGLEDLVSPGDLIAAHERETKECGDCHERFDRSSQSRLCLVCHEEVADDVQRGRGLHGRLGAGDGSECRVCHTDHKGEAADIVGLVKESFDHRRTDFALEGLHGSVPCADCHAKGERYREAEPGCATCHGDADPHRGQLGDDCQQCHTPRDWTSVEFDHASTKFPLEAGHADAACASCHPRGRFEAVSTDCVSCHRVDDAHRGRLGNACGDCHDPSGWDRTVFDHDRKTRFALRGAHARIDCRACHVSEPSEVELSMDCVSCHRLDDDHRGARGKQCGDCHRTQSWSRSHFDHTRDASFALHGAHASVACELCHTGSPATAKTPTRCVECHETEDVHRGTLGADCGRCHTNASWSRRVTFDHDFTDFPLLALHQLASCEDCHASHRFADAATDCIGCHARDDAHERRLGNDCARCHNPNGWRFSQFEHERETDFALTGGHESLECVACHVKPTSGPSTKLSASPRCATCHLSDSPHDDAYGRDCQRCHVVESWERTKQGVR